MLFTKQIHSPLRFTPRFNGLSVINWSMKQHWFKTRSAIAACMVSLSVVNGVQIASADNPDTNSVKHARSGKIVDIVTQVDGFDLTILVKLNMQPHLAATQISESGLVLSIKDIGLHHKNITPPHSVYVNAAEIRPGNSGHAGRVTFSTVPIKSVQTQIYENTVLISAQMTNPAPFLNYPALENKLTSAIKPQAAAPSTKPPIISDNTSFAVLFDLSKDNCSKASALIVDDPWNLDALADQALCLVADNKQEKAQPIIEQIENFAPNNWKGTLAKGEMLRKQGKTSQSMINFAYALQYADTVQEKQTVQNWMSRW